MRFVAGFVVSLALVLAGCASGPRTHSGYVLPQGERVVSKVTVPPEMNDEALGIMNVRLAERLGAGGMLATGPGPGVRELDIRVVNYRMRHGAARALVGVMAGTDNIRSVVTVRDAPGGSILGSYEIESSNASAWGTSRGLIQDHADSIVEALRKSEK
jgi:hypothetical protein